MGAGQGPGRAEEVATKLQGTYNFSLYIYIHIYCM